MINMVDTSRFRAEIRQHLVNRRFMVHRSYGFHSGLVRGAKDMSAYMVVANNVNHGCAASLGRFLCPHFGRTYRLCCDPLGLI